MKTLIMILLLCLPTYATTYIGSLYASNGGLVATGAWTSATLSWTVTDETTGGWDYEYVFTVSNRDISHIIIEASPTFTIDDFQVTSRECIITEVGTFVSNTSNGGMPGEMYGIKVEPRDDITSLTFSFTSGRAPIWGDFYARDGRSGGNDVYAYNGGFSVSDPYNVAGNGSMNNHILIPDTIPETNTFMIGGLAVILLCLYNRNIR